MTRIVLLGDIVEIKGGGTPDKSVESYWGGEIPWASVKDFKSTEITQTVDSITPLGVANSATNIIPAGSILVPTRMAVGKVAINTVDMAINQDLKALKLKAGVDTRYLLNALMAKAPSLEAQATGATVKGITLDVLRSLEIPLPPLEEQKRIAAILYQADDIRRKRQHAIDRLNQLGQAIFHEMFGDPATPSGWKYDCRELAAVCKKVTDGTHQAPEWSDEGVPFIFVSNVRDHKIDLNTKKFVSRSEYLKLTKNAKIDAGDVLYTCVGSYGYTAVVDGENEFIFQRHIAHIKPDKSVVQPQYLSWSLEAPKIRYQADKLATGIAQKTVTLKALKSIKIPIPPLEMQIDFSNRISVIERHKRSLEGDLKKLDSLFASLQHHAFTGQL